MIINSIASKNISHRKGIYFKSAETSSNNSQKGIKNNDLVTYGLIGLFATASVCALKRASKKSIENIVKNKILETQAEKHKNLYRNFHIESLKDDSRVASLEDLSGLKQIKTFLKKYEIIEKNKDVSKEHNIESFVSILLWGIAGTGKTSAAMGIAKKLDADFVRLDKELFDSEFISRGPRQLSEYFRNIKEYANNNKNKKLVVFMDEIDSTISVDRGLEAKQDDVLVNTLKQGILDLQKECKNVIFIGATNKDPSGIKSDNVSVKLNSAILSRFNYQFELGLPDKKSIQDAWTKLIKTQSGKEKFTKEQNEQIAKAFEQLGMSYRDVKNIANKLNIEDAVEFCITKSYNSKTNLLNVLSIDEKIGYDSVKRQSITKEKKQEIIEKLKKSITH